MKTCQLGHAVARICIGVYCGSSVLCHHNPLSPPEYSSDDLGVVIVIFWVFAGEELPSVLSQELLFKPCKQSLLYLESIGVSKKKNRFAEDQNCLTVYRNNKTPTTCLTRHCTGYLG
ncbi:hypothetical protein AVEN_175935-1 [Araneus ventricosus]|uniref:Uncharacterized protein n=1 Tax=Araneus ventricosus TaxID=182803 RepID=A0A4Y2QZ49_ARAVE|nr:hypothetical protein AVEN_175935-1 [Araneus ventricosus]